MTGQRIRFPAEVATSFTNDGQVDCWEPCTVEMGVAPEDSDIECVYDVEVQRQPPIPGDELSTIRDRVGRIARRLEDVASELRMVAEGLSNDESERMLNKIETSLGIPRRRVIADKR